jgi:hypothetical protein
VDPACPPLELTGRPKPRPGDRLETDEAAGGWGERFRHPSNVSLGRRLLFPPLLIAANVLRGYLGTGTMPEIA